ncbi:MAG: chromosome partitioning protein ParB [Marinosulfonomonas sp.]|nr:MAG: chromosome partitioning protein ParB [Marinosulfonomonas sp.]
MLNKLPYPIDKVQVPVKRAKTLDAAKVEEIAESILEEGQLTPIQLRAAGDKFILVEGLHRLEALRALGETEVEGYLVQARRH